jgi:hypothetical protein
MFPIRKHTFSEIINKFIDKKIEFRFDKYIFPSYFK